MESINEIFKEKNLSPKALEYLEDAINEFDMLFGKYVPKEKFIDRIKRNVDSIEFVEEIDINNSKSGCFRGGYNFAQKKILVLDTVSEEEKKSIFFHELLHAEVAEVSGIDGISNTGFQRLYNKEYGNPGEKEYIGIGWNEGFVQMMTNYRNKKLNKEADSKIYPILSRTVDIISEILGKKELIEMYHNNPENFERFLSEKLKECSNEDEYSINTFLKWFDSILKHEKDIFTRKSEKEENSLMKALFARNLADEAVYSEDVINAQEGIIRFFMDSKGREKLKTPEEVEKFMSSVSDLYNILNKDISIDTIETIIKKSEYDLLERKDELSDDNRKIFESYMLFSNFKNSNTNEKLKSLIPDSNGILDQINENLNENHNSLEQSFNLQILKSLYEDFEFGEDLSNSLKVLDIVKNVSQYILDNNLTFENLKINKSCYAKIGNVYELYNFTEDNEYNRIAVLARKDENSEFEEYKLVRGEELKEIQKGNSQIISAYKNSNGDVIVYDENEDSKLILKALNIVKKPLNKPSVPSLNEVRLKSLNERLAKKEKYLNEYTKLGVTPMIEKVESEIQKLHLQKDQVENSIRNARGVEEKKEEYFTPDQIVAKSLNGAVTIESLKNILDSMAEKGKSENEGDELDVK